MKLVYAIISLGSIIFCSTSIEQQLSLAQDQIYRVPILSITLETTHLIMTLASLTLAAHFISGDHPKEEVEVAAVLTGVNGMIGVLNPFCGDNTGIFLGSEMLNHRLSIIVMASTMMKFSVTVIIILSLVIFPFDGSMAILISCADVFLMLPLAMSSIAGYLREYRF